MKNKIILVILILSIIVLVFSGCGGGNPVIPPISEPIETIVPETTKVVEEETIQEIVSVTEDQSTIVFEKSTPQLEELTSGDIIAMGITEHTPEGLLRKVTNITKGEKDSSEVIVETEFATLEEAIEQGEFDFDISLQAKNMKQSFSGIEGVKLITDKSKLKDFNHEFNYEIDLIAYDGDGNSNTTEDNIVLKGFISFDYNMIFSANISFFSLKYLEFKNIVNIETDISISGGGSITFDIIRKSLLPKPIDLGTYTIMLGPVPVVLSPSIDIKWGLDGGIYGALSTGVTRTDTYTAGLEWNNGIAQPIADHNTDYNYIPLSTSKGGIIKFSIGPELMCKIYKTLGPYCNASLFIKLIADIFADPWWELQGGADVKAGVKLEIFKKTYLNVYLTVINVSESIAKADGPFGGTNHAPVISSLTANLSSININETTAITCTASDEDIGDILTYSWAKTGGAFEGSISGLTITWRAPSTPGSYTISCEVSDGDESDSKSVDILVNNLNVNKPPQPTPLSPGSGSPPGPTIDTLTPTFRWETVSNADYYALAISEYPYGTSNIIYNPQQLEGSSVIIPSGVLEAGKKYRWNMQAYNINGAVWSDTSNTLYFQTLSSEPEILTPEEIELIRKWGFGGDYIVRRWPDGYIGVYDETNYTRMQDVLQEWNAAIGGPVVFHLSNDPNSPVKVKFDPDLSQDLAGQYLIYCSDDYEFYRADVNIQKNYLDSLNSDTKYCLYLWLFSGVAGFNIQSDVDPNPFKEWWNFDKIPDDITTMLHGLYKVPCGYNLLDKKFKENWIQPIVKNLQNLYKGKLYKLYK